MKNTKAKILGAALKLFNRDGMVNVRLQHIADEAFVSVGNLAYHFATKEVILTKLYETLTKRQQDLLAEYRIVPLFDNIDRLMRKTFQLQQAYVFFYLDTLEIVRAYPAIAEKHQRHIDFQLAQLKIILEFNVSRGAMVKDPRDGLYNHLAEQVWMTMDGWMSQRAIRSLDITQELAYRTTIWSLFMPYFTDMGKREYQQMLERPYDFYF